jgi:hypothetical protein
MQKKSIAQFLSLSDPNFRIMIDREIFKIAELYDIRTLKTICSFDIKKTNQKILSEAESIYILKNLK